MKNKEQIKNPLLFRKKRIINYIILISVVLYIGISISTYGIVPFTNPGLFLLSLLLPFAAIKTGYISLSIFFLSFSSLIFLVSVIYRIYLSTKTGNEREFQNIKLSSSEKALIKNNNKKLLWIIIPLLLTIIIITLILILKFFLKT